jgi:hypothetical protein
MLHTEFQDLLSDVRKTQTKYRLEYPMKPALLKFPFHKVSSWCVWCALPENLQVIGLDSTFEFDVSVPDPPWMNANEDGLLSVHSRRSRTPVQPVAPAAAGRGIRDRIEAAMTTLGDMGMIQTYGEELCRFMLDRYNGDVIRAVESLMELGRHTFLINYA